MTREEIRERLREIDDPCSVSQGRPMDVVAMGLVDEITPGDPPRVRLRLSEPTCLHTVYFLRRVREALGEEAVVELSAADQLWGDEDAVSPSLAQAIRRARTERV